MSDRFDGLRDRLDAAARDRTADSADDETGEETPPVPDDPAFPFDETTAKSIYVRPETVRRIEDVEALVDARLRTEHEVRDLTTREFYDAALRVASEDPDAVMRAVIAARRDE